MLEYFINAMFGKIYKLLPLKEDEDSGKDVHLAEYINSLAIELGGALYTYQELYCDKDYISIVNTINFLDNNEVTHQVCKREVFKMLEGLKRISNRLGGEPK